MVCEECNNFIEFVSEKSKLYVVCKNEHKRPFEGVEILETYIGAGQVKASTIDNKTLENLSYERSMPIAEDVKCSKCKSNAIYVIEPTTSYYKYACPKCHKAITITDRLHRSETK